MNLDMKNLRWLFFFTCLYWGNPVASFALLQTPQTIETTDGEIDDVDSLTGNVKDSDLDEVDLIAWPYAEAGDGIA